MLFPRVKMLLITFLSCLLLSQITLASWLVKLFVIPYVVKLYLIDFINQCSYKWKYISYISYIPV